MSQNNKKKVFMGKLESSFDARLVDLLSNGREIVTKEGDPQRVEATAADLNVIRQRLKDCGMVDQPAEINPIGSIIEEMKSRGMKFDDQLPPLSDEQDSATA
jgi:hypothetical protein